MPPPGDSKCQTTRHHRPVHGSPRIRQLIVPSLRFFFSHVASCPPPLSTLGPRALTFLSLLYLSSAFTCAPACALPGMSRSSTLTQAVYTLLGAAFFVLPLASAQVPGNTTCKDPSVTWYNNPDGLNPCEMYGKLRAICDNGCECSLIHRALCAVVKLHLLELVVRPLVFMKVVATAPHAPAIPSFVLPLILPQIADTVPTMDRALPPDTCRSQMPICCCNRCAAPSTFTRRCTDRRLFH